MAIPALRRQSEDLTFPSWRHHNDTPHTPAPLHVMLGVGPAPAQCAAGAAGAAAGGRGGKMAAPVGAVTGETQRPRRPQP